MALQRALNANSVIVWHEDQVGNITLGPRNTVEAEIIVQSRLGTAAAEVAVARELLAKHTRRFIALRGWAGSPLRNRSLSRPW